MPLQPSRRTSGKDPRALLRHHQSQLRSLGPGYVDGHFATPQPLGPGLSQLVGGESDGGDDEASVIGEDGDRLVLTSLLTQPWSPSYIPISETLHVFFHPGGGAGVRWLRGTDYNIDEDSNVVTIPAATLAAARAELGQGDFLSAQYLRIEGEQDAPAVIDALVFRGYNLTVSPGDMVDLPDGTEIGDLLVVGSAVMRSDGIPGLIVPVDSRLTRRTHNTWTGEVTHLGPVEFHDYGADDRLCGVVATFAAPAHYQGHSEVGPLEDADSPAAAPVASASAGILVASTENPNGHGAFSAVPAGWVEAVPESLGTVSSVQMWYWFDAEGSATPAGSMAFDVHVPGGYAYATVLAIGGE